VIANYAYLATFHSFFMKYDTELKSAKNTRYLKLCGKFSSYRLLVSITLNEFIESC